MLSRHRAKIEFLTSLKPCDSLLTTGLKSSCEEWKLGFDKNRNFLVLVLNLPVRNGNITMCVLALLGIIVLNLPVRNGNVNVSSALSVKLQS